MHGIVCYLESYDLINWSKAKLIKFDPEYTINDKKLGNDNYYYFNVIQWRDKYIALSPYFKNKVLDEKGTKREYYNECTRVFISEDKINWKLIDEIFKHNNSGGHMRGPHILTYSFNENNEWSFYVQKGFLTDKCTLELYKCINFIY